MKSLMEKNAAAQFVHSPSNEEIFVINLPQIQEEPSTKGASQNDVRQNEPHFNDHEHHETKATENLKTDPLKKPVKTSKRSRPRPAISVDLTD